MEYMKIGVKTEHILAIMVAIVILLYVYRSCSETYEKESKITQEDLDLVMDMI